MRIAQLLDILHLDLLSFSDATDGKYLQMIESKKFSSVLSFFLSNISYIYKTTFSVRENKRWKGIYNRIYIVFLKATSKAIKSEEAPDSNKFASLTKKTILPTASYIPLLYTKDKRWREITTFSKTCLH